MNKHLLSLKKIETRTDSWANVLTGMGTSRDKVKQGFFKVNGALDDETADALYHEDDVASRICDGMPEFALRKDPKVTIQPDNDIDVASLTELNNETQKIQAETNEKLKDLEVTEKSEEASIWANVFGGCALVPGIDDGTPPEMWMEPLREDSIKSFTHLNVIDRRYIYPLDWYEDSREPKYNTPRTYMVTSFVAQKGTLAQDLMNGGAQVIHETRLIIFGGMRTSITRRKENNGWDDSLLTRVQKVLNQFGQSWDIIPHLVIDGNQAVFRMQGLIAAIAADEQGLVQKRMELMDMNRSSLRAVALDAESENFERIQTSYAGLREPFELLQSRLSLAARTPITLLFGRSPAGENATGEHDADNYQNQVEAYQKSRLRKPIERILYLIFKDKSGPTNGNVPENYELVFPPLKTPTEKEQAEVMAIMADTDSKNIASGVLTEDEAAISRFGPDGFSIETSINLDSRVAPETPEDLQGPEEDMNNAENKQSSEADVNGAGEEDF